MIDSLKCQLPFMKGVYIVRPEKHNIDLICQHIKNQMFREFYIFFTYSVIEKYITQIADVDKKCLVKRVGEIFTDYVPINQNFAHFGVSSLNALRLNPDSPQIERLVEGTIATLANMKLYASLRFQKNSSICQAFQQCFTVY
jgi:hypothetical protein